MSREQANTFKKFRDANDPQGNLGWSARVARKAMRVSPEAPRDVETTFELIEEERILWRLLKLPRRYIDVENAGVLPPERVRGFLRGLVSADVVDILEDEQARPVVPVELVRLKKEVRGEQVERPTGSKLRARVFRPDIGVSPPASAPAPKPTPPPATQAVPPRAAAPVSAEETSIKRRVDEAHAKMRERNHYEFLGLAKTAGPAEVKQAFVKLAREFHPDAIAGTALAGDAELQKKLDALFNRLQEANRVLSSAEERRRYDEKLATDPKAGTQSDSGKKVRRPEEARVLLKKAEHLFKVKDYAPAERHFKMALELDEESSDAKLGLAWCLYMNEGRPKAERTLEAKKLLQPLADKTNVADAAWKLAVIAQAEGQETEHTRRLQQTLRLNPRHPEAVREKRLLDMRKQKEEEEKKKGFFDKLIKR